MKINNNNQTIDIRQLKSVNTYAKMVNRTPAAIYLQIKDHKVESLTIDGKIFIII